MASDLDIAILRKTVIDLVETVATLAATMGHIGVFDYDERMGGAPGLRDQLREHLTELQDRSEELQANNALALLANAHGTIRNVPHTARFVQK